MKLLRRAIIVLLPAVLLLAQHGALAHLISHLDAGQPPAGEKNYVHLKLCGKCVSIEKLAHAASAQGFRVALIDGGYLPAAYAVRGRDSQDCRAYRSRAPPLFL